MPVCVYSKYPSICTLQVASPSLVCDAIACVAMPINRVPLGAAPLAVADAVGDTWLVRYPVAFKPTNDHL
jgi:hypothetical protein